MTIYERIRAVNGAASKNDRKDVLVSRIQKSFSEHFEDTLDYEKGTLVNGVPQRLIVSRNKSVVTEKKIRAAPGESIPLGAVVDCYNCKWLVTEIDPNRELYVNAKMEQCNREVSWQNPITKKIQTRWCTMSKPYFSNLGETKQITVSKREYKLQIPYDEETSLLDVDMRFMLEIIGGEPKTYRITCVDPNTERFDFDGILQGFLVINVEQDQYVSERDNVDLMICDYVEPDSQVTEVEFPSEFTSTIDALNGTDIKIGGSGRTFRGSFYDSKGNVVQIAPKWNVLFLDEFKDFISVETDDYEVKIKVNQNKLMEGSTIKIELSNEDGLYTSSIECKVVALI